jgi:hypothetical protein
MNEGWMVDAIHPFRPKGLPNLAKAGLPTNSLILILLFKQK